MFYIILTSCPDPTLQSNRTLKSLFTRQTVQLQRNGSRHSNAAWLMEMTRCDVKDMRDRPGKVTWKMERCSEQMLRAGVNNSFPLHSGCGSSAVAMHRHHWGESACAFCTNPFTHTQQGPVAVEHPLCLTHSPCIPLPNEFYDNSVLQRNLSKDRKKKEQQRLPHSWGTKWAWA